MRIAEDYDYNGTPIYSTTVAQECGKLLETDIKQRTRDLMESTKELRQAFTGATGRELGIDDHADAAMSDMFFNCEAVNESPSDELDIRKAAEAFHKALLPAFQERYSVEWLVKEFYERL